MRHKPFITLIAILALGMLLSGCSLFAAPTPDPAAQQATIDAAVAQAIQILSANQTSTAAALPTSTFTATPTEQPTNTPEPTATLFIPTNTWIPPTPKPTLTPTTAPYACELKSTSPAAGTKININTDYDASWVVKNVGKNTWELGSLELKYIEGTKMQTKADIFDVTTVVESGKELTVIVDMKTPSTAGKYTATWALAIDGKTLCTLPVNIEAVNP